MAIYKNHIYSVLGKELNNENIHYFVFKGSYKLELPYSGTGDLDIYVMPYHAEKFISIANSLGFVYLENNRFFFENYTRDLFYYDYEVKLKFHVHLHSQINFGNKISSNLNFNIENLLLNKRILDEQFNIYIIPPELELILLGARKKYRKGKNWLKQRGVQKVLERIIKQYQKTPSDISYLETHFSSPIYQSVNKVLNERDLNVNFRFETFQYRNIPNFIFLLRLIHKIIFKFSRISIFGKRRLPYYGKSFIFVGIDGSGKSTSIDLLHDYFKKFMEVEKISLGSGKSGASLIRKIIFSIFGTKAFLKGHKGTRNFENNNEKKKISLIYAIWILLCLFDKHKNLKKLKRSLLKGKLVLVDRWIQDIDMNFADAPRLNLYLQEKGFVGFVSRYEKALFKKSSFIIPDEIIILNVTAENSLLRKPHDLTYDQASNNSKAMLSFNWDKISNKTIINANLSREEVLNDLIGEIFVKL